VRWTRTISGRPARRRAERRVEIKARVPREVKLAIQRAVEVGMFDSESDLIEQAVRRSYEERVLPALLAGLKRR
jgi:Arc/MetJ-type ribon-helix-helix transcriptional regulator